MSAAIMRPPMPRPPPPPPPPPAGGWSFETGCCACAVAATATTRADAATACVAARSARRTNEVDIVVGSCMRWERGTDRVDRGARHARWSSYYTYGGRISFRDPWSARGDPLGIAAGGD